MFLKILGLAIAVILFLTFGCSSIERKLLFFPSHTPPDNDRLKAWVVDNQVVGYCREVPSPKNVWLMFHGNGGQASDRDYALPCFSNEDSVFIAEYPGYGARKGTPSKDAFNRIAKDSYLYLRGAYPKVPVCVVGESIGNGPAASLASLDQPPNKFVLVVPFDMLSRVAKEYYPSWLVGMMLRDDWDNVKALSNYKGPIEIFGAKKDSVIPVSHARALATELPGSKLVIIDGGHNDWAEPGRVVIRNP